MVKSRRSTRKLGLFRRIYSPLNHLVSATRNVGKTVFTRSGRIVDQGLGGVQNIGRSVVGHADGAVSNLINRKSRKNRKASRKSRKNRKNRK
jgi:hypothetical protein|uniref:Uncharacterized protein n=1 Tax=viral metagenome TaxID=1070528 RepID=A0A6C0KJA0_9ZZZZ